MDGCTIFFGVSRGPQSAEGSRSTYDFVDIEGADIKAEIDEASRPGTGFGRRFGETDVSELSRRTGIAVDKYRQAMDNISEYRLNGGLLQRKMFCRSLGSHEWFTLVPDGPWRTVELSGQHRRLSLRRYVILIFHCTPVGPHLGRERTLQAIQDAGLWWPSLYKEVQSVIRHCLICASNKAQPIVSGHQRAREYDGPFRFLIIDFVGPIHPPSARGHKYMFTATCHWSGWYWAIPCEGNSSLIAATLLFYRVICDFAGYPMCLGSDRAPEFVSGVVQALAEKFGIEQVIGTAYHPQSQSPVERPHREYKAMCKAFMADVQNWDVVAPIFQWTVRTTAKFFSGCFTPYEIVTGLKPRSPLDAVLGTGTTVRPVSKEAYVHDLVKYLKEVHKIVDERHKAMQ